MPSLTILFLFALATTCSARTRCTTDSDCKEAYLGLTKLSNGQQVADVQTGMCCKGTATNGTCYYAQMENCVTQTAEVSDQYKSIVCFKDEDACGASCCNPRTERCDSYKEASGHYVYSCAVKLTDELGFWIIGLPIIFSISTLVGLLAALRVGVGMPATGLTTTAKANLALAIAIAILGIPFYFSSAWQYGVTITVTAALGIAAVRITYRPVIWLVAFVHIALFLGLLGWGYGNVIFGSWAKGILSTSAITCSARYQNYFSRTDATSAMWDSTTAAARANANPSLVGMDWGYCGQGWFVALWVFGALDICLSAFLVVTFAVRLAWDDAVVALPAPPSSARQMTNPIGN